ncbi:Plant self-incompatibility protein S1 family [Striga hermonthica]|uniref:S-protein homolog n=1 Tax=Striga hermonthica TaxID=68872 RepID=A0A9N7N074_STRHE|nr:Plant self-incompatibility protein S1 family [Striga hermonthica]
MTPKQHQHLFILLLLTINILIITTTSQARRGYRPNLQLNDITVIVRNDINEGDSSISIHCYSSEDNIGTHNLSYGSAIRWKFKVNLWGTTKFWCDFNTKHGSGNYGVYTRKVHGRCGDVCVWMIRAEGPCLLQTNDNNQLWCQPWKSHP